MLPATHLLLWSAAAALAARAALRTDARVGLPGEALEIAGPWALGHLAAGLLALLVLRWLGARARRLSLTLPLSVCALWLLWPSPEAPEGPGTASGPPILLITLDTFRADHLGALGGRAETPHLDALAAQGALYTQAISAAPLTAPAHASMLTGLPVRAHGLAANGDRLDQPSVVPRLAEAGYATGAFLGSRVLSRRAGLDAGFQHYDDRWTWRARQAEMPGVAALLGSGQGRERRGDHVVARALRWMQAQAGPSLTWVHLYDPHTPYLPPQGWRPDAEAKAEAAQADAEARPRAEDAEGLLRNLEQGYSAGQSLLYASEVRWTDHLVGQLLAAAPPDAVVLVVGDHGESLTEHGAFFSHGADLFEPSMHVPLILRWPGEVPEGARHVGLVGVEQVAATLLDAAGVSSTPASLRAILESPARGPVEMYTPGQQSRRSLTQRREEQRPPEARRVTGLRLDGGKLVASGGAPVVWYDLTSDPEERDALPVPIDLTEKSERLMRLRARPPEGLSEAEREWLRDIGYVE